MSDLIKEYQAAYQVLTDKLTEYRETNDYDLWLEIDAMNKNVVRPLFDRAMKSVDNDLEAFERKMSNGL